MRNGNNLLVQGLIDNIFGCFVFVRKYFKGWGASASRACAGRRPAPPCLENFSYKRKHPNMLSIRPWTRGLFPFLIMLNKLFSTSQIGSSLCECASPHVLIFKCRRRTNCESLAQSPFTTFGIENVRIKRCFRRTLELKTASNRVFGLQNSPFWNNGCVWFKKICWDQIEHI